MKFHSKVVGKKRKVYMKEIAWYYATEKYGIESNHLQKQLVAQT